MALTFRQRFLQEVSAQERDLTALLDDLHARLTRLLLAAPPTPANAERVRAAVGREVMATFVGRDLAGPFTVVGNTVAAHAPYFAVLQRHVERVTRLAVEQQASIMSRALRNAPEVAALLRSARLNPFTKPPVAEQDARKSASRPYYDPWHRWVDPRGYTLSNRIWDTAVRSRQKIDLILMEGIGQGDDALTIAHRLQPFLKPGRKVAGDQPYGTTASYDALRLARTEIVAAHSRAARVSAGLNPFVEGADWVRTSGLPCHGHRCDALAAGGPYTLQNLPDLPGDSHPQCICRYRWIVTRSNERIITPLQAAAAAQATGVEANQLLSLIGPMALERLVQALLADVPAEAGAAYAA